jgi:hypothetical protein
VEEENNVSMTLKPGARLFSAVRSTEIIVVKAPSGEADITIGGAPPVASAAERKGGAVAAGHGGAAMGKRYVDDAGTIEVLQLKEAKPLPASD